MSVAVIGKALTSGASALFQLLKGSTALKVGVGTAIGGAGVATAANSLGLSQSTIDAGGWKINIAWIALAAIAVIVLILWRRKT